MHEMLEEIYEFPNSFSKGERVEYRDFIIKKSRSISPEFEIFDPRGEYVGVVWPDTHEVRESFGHRVDEIIDDHRD